MPIPSRDRLRRPVDISTLYRGAARKVDLIVDQPGLIWNGLSGSRPRNVTRGGSSSSGRAGGFRVAGRGRLITGQGSRVTGRARTGQENTDVRDNGGQPRQINWPSWYRRRPLQDITALVEAVERRRAELRQIREAQQAEHGEVQQADNAEVQQQANAEVQQEETNAEAPQRSTMEEEQEIGSETPLPIFLSKAHPSPSTQALMITPKNTNWEVGSDFLTPQRRLLDSIDKVREFWLEDQKRIQRTPAAKKAERERKVRILMSMR